MDKSRKLAWIIALFRDYDGPKGGYEERVLYAKTLVKNSHAVLVKAASTTPELNNKDALASLKLPLTDLELLLSKLSPLHKIIYKGGRAAPHGKRDCL